MNTSLKLLNTSTLEVLIVTCHNYKPTAVLMVTTGGTILHNSLLIQYLHQFTEEKRTLDRCSDKKKTKFQV